MVLGHPEAPVAQPLRVAREIADVAERAAGVAALCDRGEIEDGKGNHGHHMVTQRIAR